MVDDNTLCLESRQSSVFAEIFDAPDLQPVKIHGEIIEILDTGNGLCYP